MKNRHRNLLALALASALLSPAAWAEKGGNKGAQEVNDASHKADVTDAVQSVGPTTTDAATGTANQTARDASAAVQETTTLNDAATDDPTSQTPPPRGVHERMVKNPTNTEHEDMEKSMPPPPPTQSQGAANATAHASVTQRELWGRLDSDGDGQISATEGATDAEFNAGFQAMDSNDDGLVTDAEYQVAARAELGSGQAQGGVNAASHSTAGVRDAVGRLDANGDGSISATEAQADTSFNASFSTVDANSDGMVSSEEYRAWTKEQRK